MLDTPFSSPLLDKPTVRHMVDAAGRIHSQNYGPSIATPEHEGWTPLEEMYAAESFSEGYAQYLARDEAIAQGRKVAELDDGWLPLAVLDRRAKAKAASEYVMPKPPARNA